MKHTPVGQVNGWTFYEITRHGFTGSLEGKPLFGFAPDGAPTDHRGEPKTGELYGSLDHAMVAAVAEKHTGARGAGGSGVDTAAGWFMRMIGAGELQEAGETGRQVLAAAVSEHAGQPMALRKIHRALEEEGLVIARSPIV